jgi:hypothetical protein
MKIYTNPLTTRGGFLIGCNYWASHAGTNMWRDWQPEVVTSDLKQLSEAGLQVLRCFPLWPDFQPITQLYGGGGLLQEIRYGEEPVETGDPRSGISPIAIDHFAAFADIAQACGLKLIVGLLTGWMSGRLFVPLALQGRNVLTDPVALMWETRFVRTFVRRFKDHPAILAWDLGNECNCMAPVLNAEAAWVWTSAIANAIRVEDASRPVVSGMHSLDEPDENGPWRIYHQAELTDVLTTHPYPYFTPHCDQEPINTLRNGLHATAQTRWYGDIGNTAALAEEVGTLGPMFASERIAADYLRMVLFSLWANDGRGLLWWCGYDQNLLTHAPYDWTPIERELGLFRSDRSPKPVVSEMARFRQFLNSLPVQALPPRICEAVCILSHGQEQWGIAYASFILAKQAGIDIAFQYADQPIQDADLYLMPSVSGGSPFPRRFWTALNEKILQGAALYLSINDAILSPFKEPFGLEVQTREKRIAPAEIEITLPDEKGSLSYQVTSPAKYTLVPSGAEILGRETDGNPAFTSHVWGKGRISFLSVPIEQHLSNTPGGFTGPEAQPYWKIYRWLAANRKPRIDRVVSRDNALIGITEHPLSDNQRIVVLINYSPTQQKATLGINQGWQVKSGWYGSLPALDGAIALDQNDAAVFVVEAINSQA